MEALTRPMTLEKQVETKCVKRKTLKVPQCQAVAAESGRWGWIVRRVYLEQFSEAEHGLDFTSHLQTISASRMSFLSLRNQERKKLPISSIREKLDILNK